MAGHRKGTPEHKALVEAGTKSRLQSDRNKNKTVASKKDVRAARRAAKERFADEPIKSLEYLIAVRNDKSADQRMRMSAAIDIIEHIWGKPTTSEDAGREGGTIVEHVEHQYVQIVNQIKDESMGQRGDAAQLRGGGVDLPQDGSAGSQGDRAEPPVPQEPVEGGA